MPRANLWYHEPLAMFFVRAWVREPRDPDRHSVPVDRFRFADFLVDTGSNLTLLSEELVRDLGVNPTALERGVLGGPLARGRVPMLRNVVLSLPDVAPFEFSLPRVGVLSPSRTSPPAQRRLARSRPPNGEGPNILGTDALRRLGAHLIQDYLSLKGHLVW